MNSNTQTLRNTLIFSSVEDAVLNKVDTIAKTKSYRKNETIIRYGDKGSSLFILKSGLVKIHLNDKDGREVILKVVEKNDFFGEMSLLDGKFRTATVTAMEDSDALLIYREDFVRLAREFPDIVMNTLASLTNRLRNADKKITSLVFFDAYGKVAQVLLDLMEESGKRDGDNTVIDLHVSRGDISEMASVTRETLSRVLKEFKLRGCLSTNGRKIIIHNEEMLRKEVV